MSSLSGHHASPCNIQNTIRIDPLRSLHKHFLSWTYLFQIWLILCCVHVLIQPIDAFNNWQTSSENADNQDQFNQQINSISSRSVAASLSLASAIPKHHSSNLNTISKSFQTTKNSPLVASFSLLDFGIGSAFNSLPPPLHSLNRRQTNFSHLLLDTKHSHLYVGSTNYVLQFDQQLNLLRRLRTGPLLDSAHCSPTDCSGVDSKDIRLSNTFNKALLLEPSGSHLIACGSSKQGACFRWPLDHENQADLIDTPSIDTPKEVAITEQMLIKVPVAANDENSSTVAFVGPAHYDQPASNVLYVAVTNTKLGNYRELVPAISSRSLDTRGDQLFKIIERSFTDNARVDISSHLRDYYLVQYVYGFHLRGYVYFVQVQRRSHLRTQEELGVHSRISRVCSSDAGFHSYSEISLECADHGARTGVAKAAYLASGLSTSGSDQHTLFVSFARDHGSTLCAFPMLELERKFDENIHLCYNGSVRSRNMDYIAGSLNECPEMGKSGNVMNFCEETVKLNGSLPVVGHNIYSSSQIQFTSLLIASVSGGHSVAFVGTSNGELLQLRLPVSISSSQGRIQSELFRRLTIDPGHAILSDMALDNQQKHLFVASVRKIVKVAIHHCPKEDSCNACLAARNPFCGWCSLERRCTSKQECPNNALSFSLTSENAFASPRWLHMDSGQCITFDQIIPSSISIDQPQMIHLSISQLPQLGYGFSYVCSFNDQLVTQATLTASGLKCAVPNPSDRPNIPTGSDHVNVNLAVRSTVSDTTLVQRSFAFFDCSTHKTCGSCVSSQFSCNWCISESRCVTNFTTCLTKTIVGENSYSSEPGAQQGRNFCPNIRIENEILVPNGVRKEITLQMSNLLTNSNGKYECMIEIEGAREIISAALKGNLIICSENIYTYVTEVSQIHAFLTVLKNDRPLIEQTNITIYKCELLGAYSGKSDCSLCDSLSSTYQCSYCGGTCSYKDTCDPDTISVCPPPRIDLMHPLFGPVEGGTILTIEGSNLGSSIEQLRNKISIGSSTCEPIQVSSSVKVVCKTSSSQNSNGHSANVVLANSAGLSFSQEKFSYKRIELESVHPTIGPQSGGTLLYLNGQNFNIGSNVQVYLDDIKCDVNKQMLANKQLICRTRPSPYAPRTIQMLTVRIDNANLTLRHPFTYTQNPKILDITPKDSFYSGGRVLKVRGERLQSIQSPKMAIFNQNQLINVSLCEIQDDQWMFCPTPSIKEYAKNLHLMGAMADSAMTSGFSNDLSASSLSSSSSSSISSSSSSSSSSSLSSINDLQANALNVNFNDNQNKYLRFRIDFQLDDIQISSPLIASDSSGESLIQRYGSPAALFTSVHDANQVRFQSDPNYIQYLPDPKPFKMADESYENVEGDWLVIRGQHLNSAVSANEINVTVGGTICNLTTLTEHKITCSLQQVTANNAPNSLLSSILTVPNQQLPVIVRFGQHLQYDLGEFVLDTKLFNTPDASQSELNSQKLQSILVKVGTISAIMLFVFGIILIVGIKRKSVQMDKEYKRMHLQMDPIELTTNGTLDATKIPLLSTFTKIEDHSDKLIHSSMIYMSNLLFPGLQLNALTSTFKLFGGHQLHNELNLQRLHQLLCQQPFAIAFIRSLESQSSFTMRDQINVASLLTCSLMHRMDYLLLLLQQLLLESAAVHSCRPKAHLFLRRGEHIAEKLLANMLAVTMQRFVYDQLIDPMVRMCQTIQSHCYQGPVDAITGHAWFTLDERKLLRTPISFRPIALNVFDTQRSDRRTQRVIVLDCDSIKQVKRKVIDALFSHLPFSMRPPVSDVLLEYRFAMQREYTLRRSTLNTNVNAATTGNGTKNNIIHNIINHHHHHQQQQQQQHPIRSNNYNQCTLTPPLLSSQTLYEHENRSILLEDEDEETHALMIRSINSNESIPLNTLNRYRVPNGAIISLQVFNNERTNSLLIQQAMRNVSSVSSAHNMSSLYADGHLYECIGNSTSPTPNDYTMRTAGTNTPAMTTGMTTGMNTGTNGTCSVIYADNRIGRDSRSSRYDHHDVIAPRVHLHHLMDHQAPGANRTGVYSSGPLADCDSGVEHLYSESSTLPADMVTNVPVHQSIYSDGLDLTMTGSTSGAYETIQSPTFTSVRDRIVCTKQALMPMFDALLERIIDTNHQPMIVKWLCDLLQHAAQINQLSDTSIVHAWKCNSLVLRFWLNIVKNPQFVLDIEKDAVLTANLDVFAQLLFDACTNPTESRSNLFGAEIQHYRQKIQQYFDRIQSQTALDEPQLLQQMHLLSEKHLAEVDNRNALSELLVYANRYRKVIAQSIENDPDLYTQFQSIFELCSNLN